MQRWFYRVGLAAAVLSVLSTGHAEDDTGDVEDCAPTRWFADSDGDGHGDPSRALEACGQPSGFVDGDEDCDDSDADISPDADEVCDSVDNDCDGDTDESSATDALTWFLDVDGDGFGDTDRARLACTEPFGHTLDDTDCNDLDSRVNPGAAEVCDKVDNDCDGDTDEPDAADARTWFLDADTDGFGDGAVSEIACSQPSGFTSDGSDCDDGDATISPGAEDTPYDGIDQDCDGGDLTDADGDGFDSVVVGGTDCDDEDRNVRPGAVEVFYDGIDQDCDGGNDFDQDGDGFDADVINGGDCDDTDPSINPGVDEVCEEGLQIDSDCDGDPNTDRDGVLADPQTALFRDLDGDGQGAGEPLLVCGVSPGYERDALDCDDNDPTIFSGAAEICDGRDQNCDERIDESSLAEPALGCVTFFEDADEDGFGNPNAETCLCVNGDDAPTLGGVPLVRGDSDCNDNDATIHPPSCNDQIDNDGDGLIDADDPQCDGTHDELGELETHHERRNGHDDDCDGLVMAIELDCDADGHVAQVPADVGGALLDPAGEPLTAAGLGLAACAPTPTQPRRPMRCWSTEIFLSCDEDRGLWMYNYTTDTSGRFDQGVRASMRGSDQVDCDDQCDGRSPSAEEACDGMDNDCSGVTIDGTDSLPTSILVGSVVPGTLSRHEVDQDQDGALACDRLREDSSQTEVSGFSCGSLPAYSLEDDWNPMCSLAGPSQRDTCDGFATSAPGEREEDEDGDGFAECGTFSGAVSFSGEYYTAPSEHIYVPVWLAPSEELGLDVEDEGAPAVLVPLLLPRMLGEDPRECDRPLARDLGLLLAEDGLTLPQLMAQRPEAQARLLADVCDNLGGSCGVVELTWQRDDDEESYGALLDSGAEGGDLLLPRCEAQPEEWITRSVWLQERIIQARETIEAAECLRLYGVPCAEVRDEVPMLPGWETLPSAEEHLSELGAQWWMELGRFNPQPHTQGTLLTCDGDPTDENISPLRITGGDCEDSSALSHREMVEGEDLLAVFFGEELDCSTCFDCVDNNCDGYTDMDDPACGRCYLANSGGCNSHCEGDSGGCGASSSGYGRTLLLPPALLLALFMRRRRSEGASAFPCGAPAERAGGR